MLEYKTVSTKGALKDIQKLKNAKLEKKAKALIDIICINPFQSPPQYEKLVGELKEAYSRRINIKHGLVMRCLKISIL